MNKLYEQLCDKVRAYEIKSSFDNGIICTSDLKKHYPPESAEMRERFKELIIELGRLTYFISDTGYYICILSRINNAYDGLSNSMQNALYSLIIKLLKNEVLTKGEVKQAIEGDINESK